MSWLFFPHFFRMTRSFMLVKTNSNKPELRKRSIRKFSCSWISIPSPGNHRYWCGIYPFQGLPVLAYVNVKITQSCPTLCDPWAVAHQVPLSREFSRQEYWSGVPFPTPGDLPNPGLPHCRQILYHLSHSREVIILLIIYYIIII